jgi:hypothetical protein
MINTGVDDLSRRVPEEENWKPYEKAASEAFGTCKISRCVVGINVLLITYRFCNLLFCTFLRERAVVEDVFYRHGDSSLHPVYLYVITPPQTVNYIMISLERRKFSRGCPATVFCQDLIG